MNTERISCPFCKELIIADAIKCRFCGSDLSVKNQKHKKILEIQASTRLLYWVWLISITIFFVSVLVGAKYYSDLWGYVALGMVFIGGSSFLVLMSNVLQTLRNRQSQRYGLLTIVTFIAFFTIMFNFKKISASFGLDLENKNPQVSISPNQSIPNETPSPTLKPNTNSATAKSNKVNTNSNQIDCTGPDGKVFKTTQKECDEFNAAWGNNQNKQTDTASSTNNVTCNLSYGTYSMTAEQCLYYTQLSKNSGTTNSYQPIANYVPTQPNGTPIPVNNAELRDKCRGEVQYAYQREMSALNQKIRIISASTYEYESTQIKKTYERAEQDCISRYPL